MAGLEPQVSGVESDYSARGDLTTKFERETTKKGFIRRGKKASSNGPQIVAYSSLSASDSYFDFFKPPSSKRYSNFLFAH